MNELQRSIEELLTLYKLEPETRDIFVEGVTDKIVLERFIEKNQLPDVKVIEVHQIDFKTIYGEFPKIKTNNKAKLIALNQKLEQRFNNKLSVTIIIDIDFDEILQTKNSGQYLVYTDFNSLELYLYNSHTLDIFYKTILRSFPINGSDTIKLFNPILTDKFVIRVAINKDGVVPSAKFTPFEKTIVVNKKDITISFSASDHIRKIVNNIRRMPELETFIECFQDVKSTISAESAKTIRGHDFINLFFQFINSIKNDIGLTVETLERCLFQCIDYSKLKDQPMFQLIINKYSSPAV